MSELIPRATIHEMVAKRDRAIALFGEAHTAIGAASACLHSAQAALWEAAPIGSRPNQGGGVDAYTYHTRERDSDFIGSLKVPVRDAFMAEARRVVDTRVWSHLVTMTDLEKLMDKTAKDQLRQQLMTEPPEVTAENVLATLQQFAIDSKTIFARGIATCFSALDRRFRSHDGWKIGSRVILSRAFDEWGHWNHYLNHRDTLHDIERVFAVLDGDGVPTPYAGIAAAIDRQRQRGMSPHQTEVDSDFFKIRIYKNGNAHVWFKRDDLVDKVNQLLGDYYGGNAIPEDREAEPDTGLDRPKTALAKNLAFFPSPAAVVADVIKRAELYRADGDPPLRILEPSAGTGSLAAAAVAAKAGVVDCIEVDPKRADDLWHAGIYGRVLPVDFLAVKPETTGLYDRVIMNPPFDRERDIDHVMHALSFLKPDGRLVAVMSAGTEYRETRKAIAFRALMAKMRARFRDLPEGSFSSVGTNVNTVILTVNKDGREIW